MKYRILKNNDNEYIVQAMHTMADFKDRHPMSPLPPNINMWDSIGEPFRSEKESTDYLDNIIKLLPKAIREIEV